MTRREQETLIAIGGFWARNLRAPSFSELGLELTPPMNKANAYRTAKKLQTLGYVSMVGGKHHTVALTQSGEYIYKKVKKVLAK